MKSHFLPLHIVFPYKDKDRLVDLLLQNLAKLGHFDHAHLMHKEGEVGLCIHYSETEVTKDELTAIVTSSGAEIADNYNNRSFAIKNMHSVDCARLIERKLNKIPGVYYAAVSYSGSRLVIEYDGQQLGYKDVQDCVIGLGYNLARKNLKLSFFEQNQELFFSFFCGLFLILAWNLHGIIDIKTWYLLVLSSYFFGAYYSFQHSLSALRNFQLDIDLLMILAAFGAAFIGKWYEGALLLFLFSLGHGLEHKAMHKARSAVTSLAKLTPKTAIIKNADTSERVAVEELQLGDLVLVRPGERIACDGIVIAGASAVNQAPITGESLPQEKEEGARVFAGSINGNGALTIKVIKLAEDSTLSKMVQLMLDADAKKSTTQNFTESFERVFVPFVLFVVTLLIFLPPFLWGTNFFQAFYSAMIVLVAASPCALAIGTPAAVLAGVARSAKMGVLIKGGLQLERLAMIKILALDKTGTITIGEPSITKIMTLSDMAEDEVLAFAASIEQESSHPIALAIVHAANDREIDLFAAANVSELVGRGVLGFIGEREVVIGNLHAFSRVSQQVRQIYDDLEKTGSTVMLIAVDTVFVGAIAVSDMQRPGVVELLERMHSLGIEKAVMLTGDNKNAARIIAENAGISEYYAELLPVAKVAKITELEQQSGGRVAMLGDGVNDAPAMAKALVGIAMGGAGSDVAMDAADVVLMQDDISKLPAAFALSKKATQIIKQNVILAMLSIILLVLGAMLELLNLSVTVFLHESTSIVVVLNGLRLLRFKE
ncbi:MAG: cadmium-translocating P-type ATPase [Legionellales bacterium]|jgi:Zn2+/Cd2+-exporting ATPase|nr:cadmium-translocating P-type ATPase [Legionellales bacterium]